MATRRPKIHHGIAILPLVWALAWGVGGCTGPAATVESDGSAAAADVSDADAADAAASDAKGSNDVFADSDAGDAFLGSDSTATADSDGGDGQADATSCACGDQICDAQCAENPATCPADCAGCGDGVCAPGEGPVSCPADCCGGCGDGKCVGYACGESPQTCPTDCQAGCGNGVCDKGENPTNCPTDCLKNACGNGLCEPLDGGPTGCPADCQPACGNCVCEKGENGKNCPNDCGSCGDGTCSWCAAADESALSCPSDCKAADCLPSDPTACDDGNICTVDSCTQNQACSHLPAVATCTDGDPCTVGDLCAGSVCKSGVFPLSCDDQDPCTYDQCAPLIGCQHFAASAGPCNDGDKCTNGDSCYGGVCIPGDATDCDDGAPCTDDSCLPQKGCQHVANAAPCSDGNICTKDDLCAYGVCSGVLLSCDDNNVCTGDVCSPLTGCGHIALEGYCDDGSACTAQDSCQGGICSGKATSCDDGLGCTLDSCDATLGCQHQNLSVTCFDGNACTAGDACKDGQCKGDSVDCADQNPCTSDACSDTLGCTHLILDGYCDDGDACTVNDACSSGFCTGKKLGCEDGSVCTADSCDSKTGCVYKQLVATCDDGSACTTGDACQVGACVGSPVSCEDNNPCTGDFCSVTNGCGHIALSGYCDDGVGCTASDTCDGGVCAGTAVNCDDNSACTNDSCVEGSGCVHTFLSSSCDDGNACTGSDACVDGVCAGTAINCDDGNACTSESCSVTLGCHYENLSSYCDDGNKCSGSDACAGGACIGVPLDCDDKNVCTSDSCAVASGCVHADVFSTCDDGNPCTVNDTCSTGDCGGSAKVCDDNEVCTADSCDPVKNPLSGCVYTPIDVTCTDANACTASDRCLGGQCKGQEVNCGDGEPCTSDTCDSAAGCVNLPVGGTCTDGNVCTQGDACAGGTCKGAALVCDDSSVCTVDSCDSQGVCAFVSTPDGLQCAGDHRCVAGVCTACGAGTIPTLIDNGGIGEIVCAYDYPVWGIVRHDPIVGLGDGQTVTDAATGLSWAVAYGSAGTVQAAAAYCDGAVIAGLADWRLPTTSELITITDYLRATAPTVESTVFAMPSGDLRFWARSAGKAQWDVDFSSANVEVYTGGVMNVRCVRGYPSAAAPNQRFTLSADTTEVWDAATQRLWKRSVEAGTFTAANASAVCAGKGSGWRLASERELESLIDRSGTGSEFSVFVPGALGRSWTALPSTIYGAGSQWAIDFATGSAGSYGVAESYEARCVKSCDDANECTGEVFATNSWTCSNPSKPNGTKCGVVGTCGAGVCACPAGTFITSMDDAFLSSQRCVFDYPAWGIRPDVPKGFVVNSDGTSAIDNQLGLQWQRESVGTWTGDAGTGVTSAFYYCNSLYLSGKADWRVPSVAEYESILDYSQATWGGSKLNNAKFPSQPTGGYWTSVANVANSPYRWTVDMMSGGPTPGTTAKPVRCVRGGWSVVPSGTRLTAPGSGTVLDAATGVEWQQIQGTGVYPNYTSAQAGCTTLTLVGTGWRMPTYRELSSIADRTRQNAAASQLFSFYFASPVLTSTLKLSNSNMTSYLPTDGKVGSASPAGGVVLCVRDICGNNICTGSEATTCPSDCP